MKVKDINKQAEKESTRSVNSSDNHRRKSHRNYYSESLRNIGKNKIKNKKMANMQIEPKIEDIVNFFQAVKQLHKDMKTNHIFMVSSNSICA